MFSWFKSKPDYTKQLAALLALVPNREELLGVKAAMLPTPDDIRKDSAKLYRYSQSEDYKRFAEEAWGRIISDLDEIMKNNASSDSVAFHRGAIKRTLDLLRLSYQSRVLLDQLDQERQTSSQS